VAVAVEVAVLVGVNVSVGVAVGTGVSVGTSVGVAVDTGVSVGTGVPVAVFVGVAGSDSFVTIPSRQPAPDSTSTGLQLTSWNARESAMRAVNRDKLLKPVPLIVNGIVARTMSPCGPATPIEQAMNASPVDGSPSALGSLSSRSSDGGEALQSKPGREVVGVPATSQEAS
jgi:hypothetical protein